MENKVETLLPRVTSLTELALQLQTILGTLKVPIQVHMPEKEEGILIIGMKEGDKNFDLVMVIGMKEGFGPAEEDITHWVMFQDKDNVGVTKYSSDIIASVVGFTTLNEWMTGEATHSEIIRLMGPLGIAKALAKEREEKDADQSV